MMAPARTAGNQDVRQALRQLLAHGRAITTTELRTRLTNDGFDGRRLPKHRHCPHHGR